MKLNINNKLEDNVYKIFISFKEYGSSTMSEEEEKELVNDYSPSFSLRDIDFSAHIKRDETGRLRIIEQIEGEEPDGDVVVISIINRDFKIDESFEIQYKVSVNDILDSELGEELNTKHLVAEAKAELFRSKVVEKIRTVLERVREKKTGFEREEVEVL